MKDISYKDFIPPIVLRLFRKLAIRFLKTNDQNHIIITQDLKHKYKCYSQYHEDLIIDSLMQCKDNGFYIDIGANDPIELSNTARFYQRGWSGINIEPNPELYRRLAESRKRDINLNIGIGEKETELTFYNVSAHTLSSFNKQAAIRAAKEFHEHLVGEQKIKIQPLRHIFAAYTGGREVDFMSVDAEGYDYIVLKSNDWQKFRPKIVMVEMNKDYDNINKLLNCLDYELFFYNQTNGIFIDKNTDISAPK